jgi:hypothetical protein
LVVILRSITLWTEAVPELHEASVIKMTQRRPNQNVTPDNFRIVGFMPCGRTSRRCRASAR